jgi:hypothetical protein
MVSHIHYDLNANEDLVKFVTSRLITCFIDIHLDAFGFTLGIETNQLLIYEGEPNIYIES